MVDSVHSQTPIINSPYYYQNALTPESMMVYLSARLGSVDAQIQEHFDSQQKSEDIKKAFDEIKRLLNTLDLNEKDKDTSLKGREATLQEIADAIDQVALVDPDLAAEIKTDLSADGHILHLSGAGHTNMEYTTEEVEKSKDYLDNILGQLESAAQMNMIQLQSLMSARQTAISLATNLLAKLDESTKKVVDNIR